MTGFTSKRAAAQDKLAQPAQEPVEDEVGSKQLKQFWDDSWDENTPLSTVREKFANFVREHERQRLQLQIDSLHAMYLQACAQRDDERSQRRTQ